MTRVLAIDPGSRRLGLAISDPSGKVALPYGVLSFDRPQKALQEIREIALEEKVERIVVGLPLGLSGQAGPAVIKARELMAQVGGATGLEVVEWDERLTTVKAQQAMRSAGVNSRKQKGRIDMVAAVLILQAYLEAHSE